MTAKSTMKRAVRRMFRVFGLDVRRVLPWSDYGWIRSHGIRTVLDIGANTGQFALQIRRVLPDAAIYSFEPLADCCRELTGRLKGHPHFRAFNVALGDKAGTQTILRNEFSPSSSLLPMEELHRRAFPFTRNTQPEEIQIRRLDDVAADLDIRDNLLVKIDVQGCEDKVLSGGPTTIARAHILLVETTFRPLYKGQPLFDTIYNVLRSWGFVYAGSEHQLRNPEDGSILQSDSIFVRTDGRISTREDEP